MSFSLNPSSGSAAGGVSQTIFSINVTVCFDGAAFEVPQECQPGSGVGISDGPTPASCGNQAGFGVTVVAANEQNQIPNGEFLTCSIQIRESAAFGDQTLNLSAELKNQAGDQVGMATSSATLRIFKPDGTPCQNGDECQSMMCIEGVCGFAASSANGLDLHA